MNCLRPEEAQDKQQGSWPVDISKMRNNMHWAQDTTNNIPH